jgi:hypothetical protein
MLTGVHPFYKRDFIIAALFVCGLFKNRSKDEQFAVGGVLSVTCIHGLSRWIAYCDAAGFRNDEDDDLKKRFYLFKLFEIWYP